MNLDELRAVQVKERESDSLQPLRDTFYQDVGTYLTGLREKRSREAARVDDPFDSTMVQQLSDEIQTAEEVVEAIYDRRVGKVVNAASFAAADVPIDPGAFTTEEEELFTTLRGSISQNREVVLEIAGGSDEPNRIGDEIDGEDTVSESSGSEQSSESAMAGSNGPRVEESPESDTADSNPEERTGTVNADGEETDRITVRITRDIGEILGVDDRVYDLSAEDVVTLPTPNAEPLLDRDAAHRV